MAYLSKYTGPDIDRRLAQGTYDDAVAAGFTGSKEEFDKLLANPYSPADQEIINNKQDKEDAALETENKTVVGAINYLNANKQDKTDDRLTTDSKIVVEAINEVKYNTIVLDQKKQPREDLGFSTEQKTVVGAVNELNLKIGELDDSKQNAEDDRLDTNDTTVVGAINEVHRELDKLNSEYGQHIDDYEEFKSNTNSSLTTVQESITNLRNDKQDKTDYNLNTSDKRVTFAINEVNDNLKSEIERSKTTDETLEKVKVPYTDISDSSNPDRKTIMLKNHDSISGFGTNGTEAYNIAMVSKWDKVDLGSAGIPINLNGSEDHPTYNDSEKLAFVSELTGETARLDEDIKNLNETITTVNQNLSTEIAALNQNVIDINTNLDDEIRPAIEKNAKDIGVVNDTLTTKINETEERLQIDINYLKPRVATLETLNIVKVDPENENYASAYELQDSTGKVYGSRINIAKDQFLKNVSYENNILTLTFILADGTEFSQQVDLTDLIDEYVAGDHIEIKDSEDGRKSISVAKDPSLSSAIQIPIRTLRDQVYSQEEILGWFGATDVPSLKQRIVREGQMYLKYGIQLSGNPYYYKMPIEYIAFESANQIKLVFVGLDTRNDVTSKYEILINLDGTIIEGNSNVKITVTSIEPKDIDLSTYATKEELNDYALKSEIPDVSNLATKTQLNAKQDTLVSGTNIKTINGVSLLGEGNIQLGEGSTDYESLTNKPSINSVELSGNLSFEDLGLDVNTTWEQIQNKPTFATVATSGDYNDLTNTPDLTVYQPITDNSLATSAKTIPAAINEIKNSIDSISDPYEINLTNLLSAEDSESISTAIGGIDNLNATVQDNRIIVGTISNGNVSVSIRILGNVTTLYYLLDSVVGLTLNEVAITNTSGTLSKSVTTHSVLTENMVINSLESDETTLPLSAAQGKALDSKINNSTPYVIDVSGLSGEPTSEEINTAIGGWDNLLDAISNNRLIISPYSLSSNGGNLAYFISAHYETATSSRPASITLSTTVSSWNYSNDRIEDSVISFTIVKENSLLSLKSSLATVISTEIFSALVSELQLKQDITDNTLSTTDKTIPGAINELKSCIDNIDVSANITNAINALDKAAVSVGTGEIISSVSQENGIVTVQKKTLAEADIPTLGVAKINGLQAALDAKQDSLTPGTGLEITEGNVINVTLDTNVFFVAEQLPESPTDEQKKKICLIPAVSSSVNNEYTEYVWVVDDTHPDGYWEEFGTYTSEVDLTDYLKSADAASTYLSKTDAASAFLSKTVAASTYATQANLTAHTGNTENPHNVTAAQVGLGNVNNTSDADKPISTATQNALNGKQATLVSGTNIKSLNGESLLGSGNITTYTPSSINVATLFADTASIASGISTQIAALGNSGVTEFPVLYAGSAIGNIKPTWIRTTSGVTNMMCIADSKIWYFEIQGTTVQRAELAIS